MEGFIFRKGFIEGVHMYLLRDSDVGMDSYKEFICIYGRIHITSSHIYICRDSYEGRDSYKELTRIYGQIHI